MKKLVSLLVGLALCLGLTSFAFAEGPAPVASEPIYKLEPWTRHLNSDYKAIIGKF